MQVQNHYPRSNHGGHVRNGVLIMFVVICLSSPAWTQAPSVPQPNSALLEELTWMEVRDVIAAGKQFMHDSRLELAVRCDANSPGHQQLDVRTTQGDPAKYRLVSVPHYLIGNLEKILGPCE